MKSSLQSFLAGVAELQDFLRSVDDQVALISSLLKPERNAVLTRNEKKYVDNLAKAATDRKRYIYAVAIVSLYGLLERFVDSLIERFVSRTAELTGSYAGMPEAIRRNHLPLSVELLKALADDRFELGTTQEAVIANLHACLSGTGTFQVNSPAFVLHRGNITLDKITGFLSSVGIEPGLRRFVLTPAMAWFLVNYDPERDYSVVPDQELRQLFEPIDDLVERRNQVSHGVINVDDIESIDLLHSRCSFVRAYGFALYEVACQDILNHETKASQAQFLGKPIKVFNNSIVCFEHDSCTISIGDLLVAATRLPVTPYRVGPISSIQVEGVPFTTLALTKSTQFAVKVAFHANEDYEYFVLPPDTI